MKRKMTLSTKINIIAVIVMVILLAVLITMFITGAEISFSKGLIWKPTMDFEDVHKDEWHYDAVKYVYENNLAGGTSDNEFSPDEPATQAMAVDVLYNIAGRPIVTGKSRYSDVSEDEYFCNSVIWADENGIMSGNGNIFEPYKHISRQSIACAFCALARYKGYNTYSEYDISYLTDSENIDPQAESSVSWALEKDFISSVGQKFQPLDSISRAQLAMIAYRFSEFYNN